MGQAEAPCRQSKAPRKGEATYPGVERAGFRIETCERFPGNGFFNGLFLKNTGGALAAVENVIVGTIAVNYKLLLNVLGLVIFAALFWLTARRGVTDPVCGMKVDKAKAISMDLGAESFYLCSEHCLHAFEVSPAGQLEGQSA